MAHSKRNKTKRKRNTKRNYNKKDLYSLYKQLILNYVKL